MLKTVEGIYQNGQIELTEIPQNVSDRVQVLVTFVDPSKIDSTKLRQLIDQLETIAGIQQGFEEVNAGQTSLDAVWDNAEDDVYAQLPQ